MSGFSSPKVLKVDQEDRRERVDFSYHLSDEQLIHWAQMPILEKLRQLDEIRCFTLVARAAPRAHEHSER
ncbi:MAG: hypothetical protein HYZ17_10465 [Betaproteobacteria bacterium]|nr:hypothetical protein [Betaproteobacteria bacterium]